MIGSYCDSATKKQSWNLSALADSKLILHEYISDTLIKSFNLTIFEFLLNILSVTEQWSSCSLINHDDTIITAKVAFSFNSNGKVRIKKSHNVTFVRSILLHVSDFCFILL